MNIIKIFTLVLLSSISCFANTRVVVFGGITGWIGKKVSSLLKEDTFEVYPVQTRLENRNEILELLSDLKPTCVINAAGVTGRPNVDWCEDHKLETIRANLIGVLNLADICSILGIHLINLGTGCIYSYEENVDLDQFKGFTEKDAPNFQGSFYSYTKSYLDALLKEYDNVLNLRLRMPISNDFHPRSFITKLVGYKKLINIPNSVSVLSDLLPAIPEFIKIRLTGNLNFVNPGVISHNEVMDLYKRYVDPTHTWDNFTVEEQDKILKSKRSNNKLSTEKLLSICPNIPTAKESIEKIMQKLGMRI